MALNQVQLAGQAARDAVRRVWPNATSAYAGATAAEVYDPESGLVLGQAQADEDVVELAWVAAEQALTKTREWVMPT